MGGSSWSDDDYSTRASVRAATGAKAFAYDDDITTGKTAAVAHVSLDPTKMKGGMRECRDSADHPNSNPIYVGLDVTGSMQKVPKNMQLKLKELMALLLRKGYIDDPAICISAIGDFEARDKVPFQLGQFESGLEVENDLTNLFLEGGGGGNSYENYDIALYFLARCTKTDAWEKRGKKGYAFIICDEALPAKCKRSTIKAIFDQEVEDDVPTSTLVEEVLERWELFCIVPNLTDHYKSKLQDSWQAILGQRVIFLDDPEAIVETIGSCIGLCEESVDIVSLVADLKDVGLSDSAAKSVTRALAKVEGTGGALSKLSVGTGLGSL